MSVNQSISPESYQFLQSWIYRESGIALDDTKAYLLQTRLMPVVENCNLANLEALCAELRSGRAGVSRQVVEAMTTHETFFFRDLAPFNAIREHIVPPLLGKGRKLTFWSAAASSGQEAYSLAMLLMDLGITTHEASILATDLSEKVLVRARKGMYGSFEMSRGLPPGYQERFFQRSGGQWQVNEEVKQMVRFEQFDLRGSRQAAETFDVVLCRNVLIYFDVPTKKSILAQLRRSLRPGGYLMLGAAETVTELMPSLQRTVLGDAVAYMAV
jgi:chemotaxis protein methyltransferase CheR